MTQIFLHVANGRVATHGEEAVLAFTEGKEQDSMIKGLKVLTKGYYPNTKELRRTVAKTMIKANKFCFRY